MVRKGGRWEPKKKKSVCECEMSVLCCAASSLCMSVLCGAVRCCAVGRYIHICMYVHLQQTPNIYMICLWPFKHFVRSS